jgi:DNA polymerase I-like protein with 3'-5' exonuclease and polymerase domains
LRDIETSLNSNNILFLDVETTTFNKGHPFDPRNKLVSYVLSIADYPCFKHVSDPDFLEPIRNRLRRRPFAVCGFNIKFDLHWLRNVGIEIPIDVKVWDCQLAEFILSGQQNRFASLADTYQSYGMDGAKSHEVEDYWNAGINTDQIPPHVLESRGIGDVVPLKKLYEIQQGLLTEKQRKLVWLEGEDLKALADAEYNGIKFDVDKARGKLESLGHSLAGVNDSLRNYLPANCNPEWFNWDSGDHLSAFLYGGTLKYTYVSEVCTYKSGAKIGQTFNRYTTVDVSFPQRFVPLNGTEVAKTKDKQVDTRFYQTDGPTLIQLKCKTKEQKDILELLYRRADATKVHEMIESIMNKMVERNWEDNYIHGQFNQNVVITGRLSSSGPNLQNTPPEVDELLISRY